MEFPTTLTKFTKFYPNIFDGDGGLKISLPQEFNDLFDTQIRLNDHSLNKLALKYQLDENIIEYYIEQLQTVHILSLIGRSAINFDTSHMWGLYADNGNGIAIEFDFDELNEKVNFKSAKQFVQEARLKFNHVDIQNKNIGLLDYYRDNCNEQIYADIKSIILAMSGLHSDQEIRTIENKIKQQSVEESKNNLEFIFALMKICIIEEPFFKFFDVSDYLCKVTYQSDDSYLVNIFEQFISFMKVNKLFYQDLEFRKFNQDLIKELENIDSSAKNNVSNLVKFIIDKVIIEVNDIKNDNQIRIVKEFQTNKSLQWQHESEWRIVISEFCLPILAGSSKELLSGVGYKEAKKSLIKKRELIGIKTLDFSSDLTIDNIQIDTHLIYTPKLPKPKRIILGWNFPIDAYNDDMLIKVTNTNGVWYPLELIKKKSNYQIVYDFCKKHGIDLIRLKKTVDYENGVFESQPLLIF